MEEKNHKTLRNALDRLPIYEPPELLWGAIGLALDRDTIQKNSLANLPQYAPPPEIWQNIEAELNNDRQPQVLHVWKRYASAAAAVLLLAAAVWFMKENGSTADVVTLHQEKADDRLLQVLNEPENPAFYKVQSLCNEQKPLCFQSNFVKLKTDLDELTMAKKQLRTALGQYGNDPTLISEIVKIERERSRILEQIVGMI